MQAQIESGSSAETTPNGAADRNLSEIILDMVEFQREWSDIHVECDQPLMLRKGANEWDVALDQAGNPIQISMGQIHGFLNGIFEDEESPVLLDGGGKEKQPEWRARLKKDNSLHPALFLARDSGVTARLRCSVQRQGMGSDISIVIRHLRDVPKDMGELGLPLQLRKLATAPAGLLLVTGPTGSGKSTTVAAIIDLINSTRRANIVTVEDPVEFVHERKLSIINQREVGTDVASYADGVRDALRFVPDVIVIGEIRDSETALAAVRAGESGHLVLATLHAPTTIAAIRTMSNLIRTPTDGIALSNALLGVVAQALLRGTNSGGKHKHLAYELLHCLDSKVRDAIANSRDPGALDRVEEQLRTGDLGGEHIPMNRVLTELVAGGKVPARIAATASHHSEDRLKLLKMEAQEGLAGPKPEKGRSSFAGQPFNSTATMVFTAQPAK
ncbi:type IV pilus twitching motility protein PilT [Acidovorax sp. LjRoot118]|uniref:type IV pilus twitching motility protein PilT n=1 Tax=Acidovorax sp. LjRoot118 TaxID=3342256 RepID=UPI003ECDED63